MMEVNAVSGGVVSTTAHQKKGDSEGVHKLEKELNTREEHKPETESIEAVSKSEETNESKRSNQHHLGQNIDTVA